MEIKITRIHIDEDSVLSGLSPEEARKYDGDPRDLDHFILLKKYKQLKDFLGSSNRIAKKLINPLFSKDEIDKSKSLSSSKIKKSNSFFRNLITIDDLIDFVCKKNKIRKDGISKESIIEWEAKIDSRNSAIKEMYFKDLIIKILNPAITRIFMEDFFTPDEKNKIFSSKKFDKRGPKNLEFYFHYHRVFNRGKRFILWDDLVQNCAFFKVNSEDEETLSIAPISIRSVPIDRDKFFVGCYGNSPGASFLEIDKETRKIYVYVNEELFKVSNLNLHGDDYDFFLYMVEKIIKGKITAKINDWEVEISPIGIDPFFEKVKDLRKDISINDYNDYGHSDAVSFFMNSMFATGNKAYKNATPQSLKMIENIEKKIVSFFGPSNKKDPENESVKEIFRIKLPT